MISDQFLQRRPELLDEDRYSPRWVRPVAALTAPLSAYFPYRLDGTEHVPPGACLIACNHNAAAPHEVVLILRAWFKRFGDRPARGLAHRIAWQLPFRLFPMLQKVGAIYAHPDVARRALARGATLLVFPGGDVEALRPFGQRYRIVHDGRTGFIRLAREMKVPIVPLVTCGAHAAYVMLPGTRAMARLTRAERWAGFKAFPLTLGGAAFFALCAAFPWLPIGWPVLAAAFAQMCIPLPTRIVSEFLPPITVASDETDEAAAERVRGAMQAAMSRLAAERLTPWF